MGDFFSWLGSALVQALGPVALIAMGSGWFVAGYLGWLRWLDWKLVRDDREIAASEAKVRGDAMIKNAEAMAGLVLITTKNVDVTTAVSTALGRMEGMLNTLVMMQANRHDR